MKLVYKADNAREVQVGDTATTFRGEVVIVTGIEKPHKPSSTGKVYVREPGPDGWEQGFFPGVIGAQWIEREDQ